ncbi:MAG: 23S rRNA (cytosine1962-C5)-methyltransferase [Candidatus Marinamargulisbacteria bacterium]|jgi:23S rRNA (cytosine1962-C5)-methyltransferase
MFNREALKNRVQKRFSHLSKWAKRNTISCFRIYHRDLPDVPVIIDWYDGDAVMWISPRKRDETTAQKEAFKIACSEAVCEALSIIPKNLFVKIREKQEGLSKQYEKLARKSATKTIRESNLLFEVNLSDFLDTGLFLDHRPTRQTIQAMSEGKKVLNLFGYTGSFTCYAIAGGATHTTTVDLSPTYIMWSKRNLELNGFKLGPNHQMITEDCRNYLAEIKDRHLYDVIICDPPTFSNTKRNRSPSFEIDAHYPLLIDLCLGALNPGGTIFFSTNSRKFKLDRMQLDYHLNLTDITRKSTPEDFKTTNIHQCWQINRSR